MLELVEEEDENWNKEKLRSRINKAREESIQSEVGNDRYRGLITLETTFSQGTIVRQGVSSF